MKLHLWTPLEFYLEKSNEHKGATISLVLYHGLQQNVMSFFFCLILISSTSATSLNVLFHLYVVMMTRFEWSWIKLIKLILNKWDAPLFYIAFIILLLKANFKLLTFRLHTEADESLWGIDVVAWKSFEYSGGCACLYRVGFLFSDLLILWDCFRCVIDLDRILVFLHGFAAHSMISLSMKESLALSVKNCLKKNKMTSYRIWLIYRRKHVIAG